MIFVDVSHWNPEIEGRTNHKLMDWSVAKNAGLWGAVIKYSTGSSDVDPAAFLHAYNAYEEGIPLLGAYHFGDGSDPKVQARHFLACVHDDYGTDISRVMLMLDAERNLSSQMSVAQAEEFVQTVNSTEGRWPWVYMGRFGPDNAGTGLPSKILANCPLLFPAYGPHENNLSTILPSGFHYPVGPTRRAGICRGWQFTDGKIHGGPFPGLGVVDQSRFVGIQTLDEARAIWI